MTAADHAWQLLADGLTPQAIVQQLTPQTKPEAIHLARRLPLLAERPDADRGAALARLAARAGMKQFRLSFAPDGRVVDNPSYNRPHANSPKRELPGDGCTIEHVARYYPDKDHFQFTGLPASEADERGFTPRYPIPFTGSEHWSHFADPDAVVAMGGPEAYLAALVAAGRDGSQAFERGFIWTDPDPKPRRPVMGKHTARAVEMDEPVAEEVTHTPSAEPAHAKSAEWQPPKVDPKVQRGLFD